MFKAFSKKYWAWIIFFLIFVIHIFLRFYQLDSRMQFTWDQVDNAWAAKNIIIDHKFPLLGVPVKQNSGIYIGPIYYYLVAIFYFLTHLDPIASGILAGVTSIFTFIVLFYVTYKLFSFYTALIAVFIYSVSFVQVSLDRVQWNANLMPSVSLLIFYLLFRVLSGEEKYLVFLALAMGIFFHIHLTAIVFPVIVLLTLPLFPKTPKTLKFTLLAIPTFLVWLIPSFISFWQNKSEQTYLQLSYFNTFYQGIHLRRILQLTKDAFIQFEKFLTFPVLKSLKYILLPLFSVLYIYKSVTRAKSILIYLSALWFVVPWVLLSTYSGEISDYYFSINSFIALSIIAYIIIRIYKINNWAPKFIVVFFLIYYAVFNLNLFLRYNYFPFPQERQKVLKAIKEGRIIQFQEGMPESYLYYYYTRIKK